MVADLDFEAASAAVMAGLFGRGALPRIDRYVLKRRIGQGAMGRVYAAHDPELDREVAIKVLRTRDDSQARSERQRARLLREAQALARVTHPNVVEVYEVGLSGEDVFVAMELLEGQNLRQWLDAARRPWPAILAVLLQAAEGLAAAHAVAVVHRDFKPDNVVVGADGRTRVLDFGLARFGPETDEPTERSASDLRAESASSFTKTGALLGSPAYMAPEQLVGAAGEAAGDQYAFCVSAFEALHGVRPFDGISIEALLAAKRRERIVATHDDVPPRIDAAIRRGLAREPGDRWPSMAALIAALHKEQAPRGNLGIAVVALGVSGALLAWALEADSAPQGPCAAASPTPWTAEQREQVQQRLGGDDAVATVVLAGLDAYADALAERRSEACAAGDADPTPIERRLACLDRSREAFVAAVGVFAQAGRETIDRAPDIVAALPDPVHCLGDSAQLGAAPPADEATARIVARVRGEIAHARALLVAGREDDALAEAQTLLDTATAADYPLLTAELHWLLADVLDHLDRPREALEHARQAFFIAQAEGDDLLAVEVATAACSIAGWSLQDEETGEAWCEHGRAIASRLGDPPRLQARLDGRLGQVRLAAGDPAAAAELLGRAFERDDGASPYERARREADLGSALLDAGRIDEARRHLISARDELVALLGPDHPRIVAAQVSVGNALATAGDLEGARGAFEDALRIEESRDPSSLQAAVTRGSLGTLAAAQERYEEARTLLGGALEVFEAEEGANGRDVRTALTNLAAAEIHLGHHDRAAALLRRKLAADIAVLGETHPDVGVAYQIIGDNEHARGDNEAAEAAYRHALAIFEARLGADHPDLGYPLVGLGELLLEVGRRDEAIEALTRAVSVRDVPGTDPALVTEARDMLHDAVSGADPDPPPRAGDREGESPSPPDR